MAEPLACSSRYYRRPTQLPAFRPLPVRLPPLVCLTCARWRCRHGGIASGASGEVSVGAPAAVQEGSAAGEGDGGRSTGEEIPPTRQGRRVPPATAAPRSSALRLCLRLPRS